MKKGKYFAKEKLLKKCAHCGGKAKIKSGYVGGTDKKVFNVYCSNCQVRTIMEKTIKRATEKWNLRLGNDCNHVCLG
jgi:Lar family restriction alleviation protein